MISGKDLTMTRLGQVMATSIVIASMFNPTTFGKELAMTQVEKTAARSTSRTKVEASSGGTAIRPFRIKTPEADLTDLRRRIASTRWPSKDTLAEQSHDVQLATSH